MSALDEDLLNRITYSPECQATFRKYKGKIILKIVQIIGVNILVGLIPLFFIVSGKSNFDFSFFCNTFLLFLTSVSLYPQTFLLPILIRDFNIKKLEIKTDFYLNRIVKEKSDTEVEYIGIFQEAGEILNISEEIIKQLKRNTKVYIVRTVFSKTLLDIIPADKIDHPT